VDLTSHAVVHHKVILCLSFLTFHVSLFDSETKKSKYIIGHMREYK